MADPRTNDADEPQAKLSAALTAFLIDFSVGVHHHAMYPPDHPSLQPAAEAIQAGLASWPIRRDGFPLGSPAVSSSLKASQPTPNTLS